MFVFTSWCLFILKIRNTLASSLAFLWCILFLSPFSVSHTFAGRRSSVFSSHLNCDLQTLISHQPTGPVISRTQFLKRYKRNQVMPRMTWLKYIKKLKIRKENKENNKENGGYSTRLVFDIAYISTRRRLANSRFGFLYPLHWIWIWSKKKDKFSVDGKLENGGWSWWLVGWNWIQDG